MKETLAFLDTETTGLDPRIHELIEIAIITERSNGIIEEWSSKIKPEHIETAHPRALEINGYNERDWEDAPSFIDVAEQIAERLSNVVVVGHNVSFDVDFVNASLKSHGIDARISYHKIDTVTLAFEHLVPIGLRSVSFDNIRKFLGWSRENAHTALKDTRDARRLFHMLLRASEEDRVRWALQIDRPL